MWYVIIRDSSNPRKAIPLAGPYDTKVEADRVCPTVFHRYIAEHDQWAVYGVHGVAKVSNPPKASVYGKV